MKDFHFTARDMDERARHKPRHTSMFEASVVPLALLIIVVIFCVLLKSQNAFGASFQNAGPTFFGDDNHSATITPYPAIPVSTIASNPPGQCSWINTGLTAFSAANPADGSGPSGQAYTFSWAGVAAEAQIEAGLSILDYYPYVVNKPAITAGNGTTYAASGPGEFGGAIMNLKYTPQGGAPALPNLHWIQGLTGTIRGNTVPTGLDNFTSLTTFARDNSSPFYDGGLTPGIAGTLGGGGGYFLDRPLINENEYETNPVASLQFQVILANDTTSVVGGVTQNAVTLYGGEWWGFNYSATDVPEPSACLLAMLCGCGLLNRSSLGNATAAIRPRDARSGTGLKTTPPNPGEPAAL